MLLNAYIENMLFNAYTARMDYLVQTSSQLASHIRSLRRAQNLTQAQLGALVGLDQTRIAKIEKDARRISVDQLVKILGALGVRMLLEWSEAPSRRPSTGDASEW
jgi:HTH-type transcriptional regulator/antitoxin HipB